MSLGTHTLAFVYVSTGDRSAITFTEQGFRLHNVRRLGKQKAEFSPRPSGGDGPVCVRKVGARGWTSGLVPPPSLWLEPVERSIGRLRRRTVENPRVTRIERPVPADGSSLTGRVHDHGPPVGQERAIRKNTNPLSWRRRGSTGSDDMFVDSAHFVDCREGAAADQLVETVHLR